MVLGSYKNSKINGKYLTLVHTYIIIYIYIHVHVRYMYMITSKFGYGVLIYDSNTNSYLHFHKTEHNINTGGGSSQAFDGDVLPDCQWYGVLGPGEVYTQRPGC